MSEHKTEQKTGWTPSTSTRRTMNLVLIACAAMLLVLELFDFEFPLSLVQIGLWALVIGVSLNELRKTYRPEVSEPEPGRLERVMSLGISRETVRGRLLHLAVWWGIGLLVAWVLVVRLG